MFFQIYFIHFSKGDFKRLLWVFSFHGESIQKNADFIYWTTCILFGDAAGAVIVERSEENCLLETITETNGEFGKDLYLTSQKNSINDEEVIANNKLHQNGRIVYKWAIQTLSYGLQSLARKNCLSLNDIAYFLPHSANYGTIHLIV